MKKYDFDFKNFDLNDLEENIGANLNLRDLRKEKGLTQVKLGELCGIAQSCIHYIENGIKSPTLYTINCLAKGLALPIEEVMASIINCNKKLYN